jgi:hypothetical protein
MKLDASVPCGDSFVNSDPSAIQYVVAHGNAGVASLSTQEGVLVGADPGGAVFGWKMGTRTLLGYTIPGDVRLGFSKPYVRIVANTAQLLVLGLYQKEAGYRLVALNKPNGTWRIVPASSDQYWCVRAFGGFIAVVEARNRQGHEQEIQSVGKSEWRKKATNYGPITGSIIEGARAAFTGRLHVYDVDHDKLFTIPTGQADSEILLIEATTVYYRVTDRLFAADITAAGIQSPRLLVKSDVIDDVHWAFMGR